MVENSSAAKRSRRPPPGAVKGCLQRSAGPGGRESDRHRPGSGNFTARGAFAPRAKSTAAAMRTVATPGKPSMSDSGTQPYDRTVFYVSDGTGVTAETFGHSLLTQFEHLRLREVRLPFIDSVDKARQAVERIDRQALADRYRPIVFSTLVDGSINDVVRLANCRFLDLFATFVEPLENEFGVRSTHTIGRSHTAT